VHVQPNRWDTHLEVIIIFIILPNALVKRTAPRAWISIIRGSIESAEAHQIDRVIIVQVSTRQQFVEPFRGRRSEPAQPVSTSDITRCRIDGLGRFARLDIQRVIARLPRKIYPRLILIRLNEIWCYVHR
jgi:hypothetical protein